MGNDFTLLWPEMMVAGLAFSVLAVNFITPSDRKVLLGYLSAVGLAGTLVFTLFYSWGTDTTIYGGLLRVDDFSLFFKVVFLLAGVLVALTSIEYVRRYLEHPGEYYGILLFIVLAAMLIASSGELLTAYISLELLSFGLYVLVSVDRYNPKSNEAATKYILLGALSSGFVLYGISQVYGHLGTTHFQGIGEALTITDQLGPGLFIGIVMIIVGLGFRVAAVPFHMWAPDAYEGAPTPVAAYLAVGSSATVFALVLRFFVEALVPTAAEWQPLIVGLAVMTMLLGNLVAIAQSNLKRLLAYSSIGHAGYLLMGVAALVEVGDGGLLIFDRTHLATNAVMFHIVAYSVTNMAAFFVVTTVYNAIESEELEGLAGLGSRAPGLAMVLTVALFSLAGLPIFAGFISKFYLFTAVAAQDLLWLAGLAILMSLVSLYCYLRVVRQIYIQKTNDPVPIPVPRATSGVMALLLLGMVLIGIYPTPLMEFIQNASDSLLSAETILRLGQSLR